MDNETSKAGEINLDDACGGMVGEIETIGPGTTASMTVTLGPGSYTFRCLMAVAMSSATVQVTGPPQTRRCGQAGHPGGPGRPRTALPAVRRR